LLAGRSISPRIVAAGGARGEVVLTAAGVELRRWSISGPGGSAVACQDLPAVVGPAGRLRLTILSAGGPGTVALDALSVGAKTIDHAE
jgi:hypothetical protein